MTIRASFHPHYGTGQILSPAAGSLTASIDPKDKSVCLTNQGSTNYCYVRIGTGTFNATTADYPVPPGQHVVVSKAEGDDKISYISASGTTLHVMTGEGF